MKTDDLIRALAAFPLFSPVVGGDQIFRPIPLGDLSAAVVAALKPTAPSHRTLDMPGPEPVTMVETMRLYRGWMGLSPAPVVRVPRALAAPVNQPTLRCDRRHNTANLFKNAAFRGHWRPLVSWGEH